MSVRSGGRQILIHGIALVLAGLVWGLVVPIAASQAGASGGEPWHELIVKLTHVAGALGLIAAWTLLLAGLQGTLQIAQTIFHHPIYNQPLSP